MTANKYSTGGAGAGSAAQRLKQALVDFATSGELGVEFARQKQSTLKFKGALDDFEELLILDWFIFDWMDEDGGGVIDRFLASRKPLNNEEQQMVVDWGSSIHNIFEICDVNSDRLILKDVDEGTTVTVKGAIGAPSESNLESGRYLMARLLPVQGGFHFSGPQLLLPDREAALQALEMAQSLGVVVSPGEIEEAQADQRKGFIEFFGSPEITLKSSELDDALARFEKYLLFDRRQSHSGMSKAESSRARFGVEVKMPAVRRPVRAADADQEITLLCDEFEGIVALPSYADFRRVFETDDPDRDTSDWQELVWNYIKDPDIPIVAFEYIAEKEPDRLERSLRILLGDKSFSIEHLYAMLLHYKEPVEGLDNLKDDEKLWDLLDGKQAGRSQGTALRRKTAQAIRARRPAAGSATPSKKATPSSKQKRAKLQAAAPTPKARKKPASPRKSAVSAESPSLEGSKKASASKKATGSRKGSALKKVSSKKKADRHVRPAKKKGRLR